MLITIARMRVETPMEIITMKGGPNTIWRTGKGEDWHEQGWTKGGARSALALQPQPSGS